MAQNMRCHVRTEAGTLDGRPPCLRESPNLLAVEMDHKFRAVKLSPASQVAEDTPTKAHRRRALSRLLPLAVAPAPHHARIEIDLIPTQSEKVFRPGAGGQAEQDKAREVRRATRSPQKAGGLGPRKPPIAGFVLRRQNDARL